MKITGLQIDSYRHLQNLTFDFTYPEGHAKAGQPLEKICIIGQSATGKTGLLELVRDNILRVKSISVLNDESYLIDNSLSQKANFEFEYNNNHLEIGENKLLINGKELIKGKGGGFFPLYISNLKLLYYTADIISKEAINIFNQNPQNIFTELLWENNDSLNLRKATGSYIYEFLQKVNKEMWLSLLYNVLEYRKEFTQVASELLDKAINGDLSKLAEHFDNWSKARPNPLKGFASMFNPILQKLNLEVDLVNTEYSIPIKSHSKDEIIPFSALSTGTKSLLLSMFPLFELDTAGAIILIDEPERSLFPDIQIDLVDHYQRLAPDAQFMIVTHSPFIAAAFQPEERFILYFDEQGNVAVRRGESPIGDDPNDMLRKDFDVSYYNRQGIDAYNRYRNLKQKMATESDTEKKNELLSELTALGDKYKF